MLPKERRRLLEHFDLDDSVARRTAVVVGGETPASVARDAAILRNEADDIEALAGAVLVSNADGAGEKLQSFHRGDPLEKGS